MIEKQVKLLVLIIDSEVIARTTITDVQVAYNKNRSTVTQVNPLTALYCQIHLHVQSI